VIEIIMTSSFLILIILVVRTLFKGKISARMQYVLWLLVAIRLLIPVNIIESDFSILNFTVSRSEAQAFLGEELNDSKYNIIVESPVSSLEKSDTSSQVSFSNDNNRELTKILSSAKQQNFVLFSIWVIGFFIFSSVFLVINLIYWRNLKRERIFLPEIKENLPVYLVNHASSPCLFGLFFPKIYVTQLALEENRLRYVLAHEMQHYRNLDYIWSMVRAICLAVYWFNPFVWIAAIASKQDCELACDEDTIRSLGEQERISYGRALVDLAVISNTTAKLGCIAVTMNGNNHWFKERIIRISKKPKILVRNIVILFVVLLIAMCSTFTGPKRMMGKEREDTSYIYGNSFRRYFSEGLAAQIKEDNDGYKVGYIDKEGKEVIPFIYGEDSRSFSEGLAAVEREHKLGYINEDGKEIINFVYDDARNFNGGLAAVKKEDKWGYIDQTGKEIIHFTYDYGWAFSEGVAAVEKDNKWGYIDKTGKEIIPFIYDDAAEFNEELAPVKKGDKYGFIDKTGKEVIPFIYDYARVFSDGLAGVEKSGKWGFIDKTGNETIPFIYENVRQFSEGLTPVQKNSKWGYIDKTGKEVIPFIYEDAEHFSENLAIVCNDGKPQYIRLPEEIAKE
jgi:beta-lactamase regulating signal transducer with metallopeptidase domain